MNKQNGRVSLITGASSGIGQATVIKFASEGFKVVGIGRNLEKLEQTKTVVSDYVDNTFFIQADLTKETEIERVVKETVEHFGRLDVLVNAAGIIASGTIENTSLSDWDYMMNLNVRSPFFLIQNALPQLIENKGSIINVSSVTGIRAFPGVLSYCVSKAALDQMTHCVALEVAKYGVRINSINPGVVRTNLHLQSGMTPDAYGNFLEHSKTTHPLGRVGRPEEVANLIFFLATQADWITGINVPIDGGRSQTCAR